MTRGISTLTERYKQKYFPRVKRKRPENKKSISNFIVKISWAHLVFVITWYKKVHKLADWELFWYQKVLLRHHSFGTKVHYQPANKDRITSDELHVFQRTSQIEHYRTKHTKANKAHDATFSPKASGYQ